jgi:hypothetical protein
MTQSFKNNSPKVSLERIHRAIIRDEAESTKMRIVCDFSAKADRNSPSLNDCLDPGPPIQNKLWNVLVRGRYTQSLSTSPN